MGCLHCSTLTMCILASVYIARSLNFETADRESPSFLFLFSVTWSVCPVSIVVVCLSTGCILPVPHTTHAFIIEPRCFRIDPMTITDIHVYRNIITQSNMLNQFQNNLLPAIHLSRQLYFIHLRLPCLSIYRDKVLKKQTIVMVAVLSKRTISCLVLKGL